MAIVKRRNVRLYLERELTGDTLALGEREAHYLGTVLRLRSGDRLVAFDGRGTERAAVVRSIGRRGAELELEDALEPLPESPLALTLVQAVVKSDAMDRIVQKATELGVAAIAPAFTEFGVVKLENERSERRVEHWLRIAQSACEQSGRHVPPAVHPPAPLGAVLDALAPAGLRLSLVPGASCKLDALPAHAAAATVAIGPEGGWGAEDLRELRGAGFEEIDLGPRILRADTAALAACALLQQRWGDL